MADYLRPLFAYDGWANREVLAALRAEERPPARAVELLAHIVAAQEVWWGRIRGEPPATAVWPELSLDACAERLARLGRQWEEYLAGMTAAELRRSVSYTNTAGERWGSTVEDILRHVLFHSTYHRGQIATHVRAAGRTPVLTDYIHAVRQGFVP